MKILQVVTYISPDGAYGGPVRVAINQAKELKRQGHDVIVAAAAGGFEGPLPTEFDGFPVRLFHGARLVPKSGYAGMTSLPLIGWLRAAMRQADVVHVHLARDLVTLPSACLTVMLRKPLVVQTHGMIKDTRKWLAKPLDALATRPVLSAAARVLYLTKQEERDLIVVGGRKLPLVHLPNAVEIPTVPAVEQTKGPAQEPRVLYLARLHPRKRPELVVRAARALKSSCLQADFAIYGADEGSAYQVKNEIIRSGVQRSVRWYGPIPPHATQDIMRSASIYVLPSVDEPFPMSVLEAMSLGLPVIITDTCGLASIVREADAGIVCGASQGDFTQAIERLLRNPQLRRTMGANGRKAMEKNHSMVSTVSSLSHIYAKVSEPSFATKLSNGGNA